MGDSGLALAAITHHVDILSQLNDMLIERADLLEQS